MSERGGCRCCINNCQSASSEKRGIKETLFRFPKEAERFRLWILASGRDDLLLKKPIELYNNYRVCKLHFEDKMFLNYEKTRLQPNAVSSCIARNNNEEAGPSMSNITVPCTSMQDLEHRKTNFLVPNNNESNTINLTEMDTIHTEEEEIRISMSDVGMQTNLSLSSQSPRKRKLNQRIKKYKKRIADLESTIQQMQDAKMEDINALDMLLDKYYPEQTANFLKLQARLFKKRQEVEGIALHLSNIV